MNYVVARVTHSLICKLVLTYINLFKYICHQVIRSLYLLLYVLVKCNLIVIGDK